MRFRLAFLLIFPLLLTQASTDDLHDRFDRVVKKLRSDDAAARDEGSAELEAIAKEAPDLVKPLAEDKDPEVKGRALAVLKRLESAAVEAFLKKVEERYATAKTLQYKCVVGLGAQPENWRERRTLATKAGNLLRIDGLVTGDFSELRTIVVCDATNLEMFHNGREMPPCYIDVANVDCMVRAWMVRVGLEEALYCDYRGELLKSSETYVVEDLKFAADEKVGDQVAKVLTYTVKVNGRNKSWKQKLWIDAETEVLLKREGTSSDGQRVTESYSDTKFDEEIPDERFELPKKKRK
ncbi:MAG: hypothetical protein K8T20_11570 [Planctomycetes bacterium]|nr:hypothetical protein [Planctomycetota bacterium]